MTQQRRVDWSGHAASYTPNFLPAAATAQLSSMHTAETQAALPAAVHQVQEATAAPAADVVLAAAAAAVAAAVVPVAVFPVAAAVAIFAAFGGTAACEGEAYPAEYRRWRSTVETRTLLPELRLA